MAMLERNILKVRVETERNSYAERLEAERRRMAKVINDARAPDICGPRIIPAPGRGSAVVAVAQGRLVPSGEKNWAVIDTGWAGLRPLRKADAFDLMLDAARRAERAPSFSPDQVSMARHYRDLVERHDAGGVKCSALDGRVSGGTGRDFMDAYLTEGREIAAIRRRIGTGAALVVRRVRPSARGGVDRRTIDDRTLVDMVCLGDASLSRVLKVHGWVKSTTNLAALIEALCGALNRMIGYRGEKTS